MGKFDKYKTLEEAEKFYKNPPVTLENKKPRTVTTRKNKGVLSFFGFIWYILKWSGWESNPYIKIDSPLH